MPNYIYILSNPSLPTQIKIGKTTKSPRERLNQLSGTSLPTPFILEASFLVEDCHVAEKRAHQLLKKYRTNKKREFFELSPIVAIKAILPVIAPFELHSAKDVKTVTELIDRYRLGEKEFARQIAKREKQALEQRQIQYQTLENELVLMDNEICELQSQQKELERSLLDLGIKPQRKKLNPNLENLTFLFIPLPFGFIFWGGALRFYAEGEILIANIFTFLIGLGWFAYSENNKIEDEYLKSIKPFDDKKEQIESLKNVIEKKQSVFQQKYKKYLEEQKDLSMQFELVNKDY